MSTELNSPIPSLDSGLHEEGSGRANLDELLNQHFAGKVVRKDLTKLIKEGANVPVYVLEYLLGMYCSSNDEATIQNGLQMVKRVLAENYVRADEAEKVKSKVRESGTYKVIDKITVKLNEKRDVYEALLSNLGVKNAEISDTYVRQFEKLLVGGIWCIVTLKYQFEEDQRGSPFTVTELKPIQMPNIESPRFPRRLKSLRGLSHEQCNEVFRRGARTRSADGAGGTGRVSLPVEGRGGDCPQDRLHAHNPAELGQARPG